MAKNWGRIKIPSQILEEFVVSSILKTCSLPDFINKIIVEIPYRLVNIGFQDNQGLTFAVK
jgi:hypothetical protein